jgi:hypothetical protein
MAMDGTSRTPARAEPNMLVSLLDRGQPLGILPTWSFWRDKRNVELVKWPLRLSIAGAFAAAAVLSAGWLLSGLAPVLGIVLCLGLIERYVRSQAARRREALASGDSDR